MTTAVQTAADLLARAKLDWTVSKRQMMYPHDGQVKNAGHMRVITRDDNGAWLSTATESYGIVQNSELARIYDEALYLLDIDLKYVKAGSFGGGRSVWLKAKLPGGITLKDRRNDTISKEFYFFNSHDGSAGCVLFAPKRNVCSNTLTFDVDRKIFRDCYGFKRSVRLIHKGNMEKKIDNAIQAVKTAAINFEAYAAVTNMMVERSLRDDEARKYFKELTMTPKEAKTGEVSTRNANVRTQMFDLYQNGRGNEGEGLWDAYNAVTEYVDHYRLPKTKGNNRLELNLTGTGAKLKNRALNLALEMVSN